METLLILVVVGLVIAQRAGAAKRAQWRRNVREAFEPEAAKLRRRDDLPDAVRRFLAEPPAPTRPASSLPPPSRSQPPSPSSGPLFRASEPEPHEIEHEPPPSPADPVVIITPDAEADDAPGDDHEAEANASHDVDDAADTAEETAEAPADLSLRGVLTEVFGSAESAHVRAARFEELYVGQVVHWTATVLRSAKSRRHREPTRRVEVFLGYATDQERYSDRVVAEVYFPIDTELERDREVVFTATLAEANVYGRRLVLDAARLG